MYLQYICSVLFLSLNLQKFGEKISITIIQLSQLHLHFLSYISHKRVCFWGNYANIYNPADKSLNLVRCEFWCLRLFSIHGKQTTNDNDGQTFRGLLVAWWPLCVIFTILVSFSRDMHCLPQRLKSTFWKKFRTDRPRRVQRSENFFQKTLILAFEAIM